MKVKSESEVAQSCPTLATPWTAAYQAPPSMGFSRQKYWSGVPLPSLNLKAASVNIRSEREDVTTDPTDTKGIMRIYDEQPMSINVKQMN